MKTLNMLLILSLLVFVVTGCQHQANTPNIPAASNIAGAVQSQTPVASGTNTPDQAAADNVTVGDNPDTGDVSAPDVDTSALS